MTKILIDRSTVEQALGALEAGPDVDPIFAGETADALRVALAEQQRRKTGKPKNATTRLGVVCFEAYARSYVGSNRWDIAAEAVRRAALAEPVQEPDSPERRCGGPGCDMRCCQPVEENKDA